MSSLLASLRAVGCVVFFASSAVVVGCDDGGSPVGGPCNDTAGTACESDSACVADENDPRGGVCRAVCEATEDCDEGFGCVKKKGLLDGEDPVDAVCVPDAT